jgi:hypothetical protein
MNVTNVYLCRFVTVDSYVIMQEKCDQNDSIIVMVTDKSI